MRPEEVMGVNTARIAAMKTLPTRNDGYSDSVVQKILNASNSKKTAPMTWEEARKLMAAACGENGQ